MRPVLAAIAALLLAAAGGCGGGTAPYDPCAGKACGDACRVCPPGLADCGETGVIKACDARGSCVAGTPGTCAP